MLRKRLLCCLIIITVVGLVLSACTSSPKQSSTGPEASSSNDKSTVSSDEEKATLTVWVYGWETDSVKVLQDDAKEWKKSHPNVTVNIVPVASDTYDQKMQATLAGGTNPDIAFIDAGVLSTQLADKGRLLALDEYGVDELKDRFYEEVWNTFVWKGKTYGLRLTSNNLALFYNKEMFDKAGVSYPNENWTWEDLESAAKKLTDPSKKQYGIELPVFTQGEWKTWIWMTFLWQNGGEFLDADRKKALFNGPEGVGALDFWNKLVNVDKVAPLQAAGAGVDRFAAGQCAMTINGPWMLRQWTQDPKLKDKLEVAPLPKKVKSATNLGGEGFVIFSNTKFPKQAYEYVKHVTTDDEFVKKFWKAWITVPPIKEYANFYKDDTRYGKYMQVFADQMQSARMRQFTPTWPQITDTLSRKLEEAIYKGKPSQQALDEAAQEINKLLGQ